MAKLKIVATEPDAITVEELRDYIERDRPDALLDVLLPPDVARYILEHHNKPSETNRRVSRAAVAVLAESLRDGTWTNTGEPIVFSDEGWLNDGQHRLLAIEETQIAASVDIRFGVPRRAFSATNTGAKRQPGDALTLNGIEHARSAASVARMILAYDAGLPTSMRGKITNPRIVGAVQRWPDIAEALSLSMSLPRKVKSAPTQALAWFALRTAPRSKVDAFFHTLKTGEGVLNDPAHRLREKFIQYEGGQDTNTRIRFFALCVIAWNAYRRNEQLTRLEWKQTDKFPRVEGLTL